jgi:hypothetical protein
LLPVTFEANSERETDRGGICVKKEKSKSLFLLFKKVSPALVENECTSIENPKKKKKKKKKPKQLNERETLEALTNIRKIEGDLQQQQRHDICAGAH